MIVNEIQLAWLAGIAYFILGFPEAFLTYQNMEFNLPLFGKGGYVLIKILVIVSFAFFIRGFILLGRKYNNRLLVFSSYIYLSVVIFNCSVDIFSVFYSSSEVKEVAFSQAILYGLAILPFGMGLLRMQNTFGRIANYAGILEIIIGITFLTVVLFILGLVLQMPAELLEVYILFKFAERVKSLDGNVGFLKKNGV